MSRTKLQKLLNKLDGTNERTAQAISEFEGGVKNLREKLQQEISASTLEEVNLKINRLRKSIDLQPILDGVKTLEDNFRESILSILTDIEAKNTEYKTLIQNTGNNLDSKSSQIEDELNTLRDSLNKIVNDNVAELNTINNQIISLSKNSQGFASKTEVTGGLKETKDLIDKINKSSTEDLKNLKNNVETIRNDLLFRLSQKGGGNMNRQILVGGNPSTLGKYTDVNLKAGNNVTITYSDNNTTKRTDITISATGGSGSVGGVIRNIQTINTSQAMASVAGTDYVYLCSGGIKLDLPSASGNTNLYTVKNVSNSSILIGGTIDDDVNGIIMPIKYTSVDLISNDTDWDIT